MGTNKYISSIFLAFSAIFYFGRLETLVFKIFSSSFLAIFPKKTKELKKDVKSTKKNSKKYQEKNSQKYQEKNSKSTKKNNQKRQEKTAKTRQENTFTKGETRGGEDF